MANATEKVNGIAIANIQAINGITDGNLQALNGLEFTGYTPTEAHTLIAPRDIAVLGASSSITITSGIDDTYDVYEFHFTNIHAETQGAFGFQVNNATDGADYNDSLITSTAARAYKADQDAGNLGYRTGVDLKQESSYQHLTEESGTNTSNGVSGVLTLYNPSSGTYVKHFVATVSDVYGGTSTATYYVAGYVNETTAIDEISFKFAADEIQGGEIKMYGIAKA